jgi:hypothetical protein
LTNPIAASTDSGTLLTVIRPPLETTIAGGFSTAFFNFSQ